MTATLGMSLRGRLHVTHYKESRVAFLQSDEKKQLYFQSRVSSRRYSIFMSYILKEIVVPRYGSVRGSRSHPQLLSHGSVV